MKSRIEPYNEINSKVKNQYYLNIKFVDEISLNRMYRVYSTGHNQTDEISGSGAVPLRLR